MNVSFKLKCFIIKILSNSESIEDISSFSKQEIKDLIKIIVFNRLESYFYNYLSITEACKNSILIKKEIKKPLFKRNICTFKTLGASIGIYKQLNNEGINFRILKGAYLINKFNLKHRQIRDLDILVDPSDLEQTISCAKKAGYYFYEKQSKDEYLDLDHRYALPMMIDKENNILEIHHRITDPKIFQKCSISELIMKDRECLRFKDYEIQHSSIEANFCHILYHGIGKQFMDCGPQFINDLILLSGGINDGGKKLQKFIHHAKLEKEFSLFGAILQRFSGLKMDLYMSQSNVPKQILDDAASLLIYNDYNHKMLDLFLNRSNKGIIFQTAQKIFSKSSTQSRYMVKLDKRNYFSFTIKRVLEQIKHYSIPFLRLFMMNLTTNKIKKYSLIKHFLNND